MEMHALFEQALGVIGPWVVKELKFEQTPSGDRELHIQLDFPSGSLFKNSLGEEQKAYDTSMRTWRHLNFFQYKCYLHARVPRVKQSDGKYRIVEVPWARTGSGFTLLFEAFIMALFESEMTVSGISQLVDEYDQRLWAVLNYWVKDALAQDDQSGLTQLGMDETSTRKGHHYVTIAADLATRRVVNVQVGKGKKEVEAICKHLEAQGSPSEEITDVSIDMSPAFIGGCLK